MVYKLCIGCMASGAVIKEFPNRKAREAYIQYLSAEVLSDQDVMDYYAEWCRATCRPGSRWVLNFQKPVFQHGCRNR